MPPRLAGIVAQRPDQPDALLGLGAASWMEGRPGGGPGAAQAALQANPSDPLVYLYMGLAWQDLAAAPSRLPPLMSMCWASAASRLWSIWACARLLAIYTQIVPAAAGQEGGQGAAVP